MDIRFFFEQRLQFIRQFYINGSTQFEERKRKIDSHEEPFVPPYSEDGEPPFLCEWLEADDSIQVLGSSCISMLSASLQVYFKEWHRRLGYPEGLDIKAAFKNGWPNGYKLLYEAHGSENFDTAPINLGLIEELVLARNCIQHPGDLTRHTYSYTDGDVRKMQSPIFISDRERDLFEDVNDEGRWWLIRPSIHVNAEKLESVLNQVSEFVQWVEIQGEKISHDQYLERQRLRELRQTQ